MTITSAPPSPQAQSMLKALQSAVTKSLERKQKLGQYAVTWQNGAPALVGEDAPALVEAMLEELSDQELGHTVLARMGERSQAIEVDIDALANRVPKRPHKE